MAELGFFGFLTLLVVFFVFKKAISHAASKAENVVKVSCNAVDTTVTAIDNEISKIAVEQHIEHSKELQAMKEQLGIPDSTAKTFAELVDEIKQKK